MVDSAAAAAAAATGRWTIDEEEKLTDLISKYK
jgi:hypothetical protein